MAGDVLHLGKTLSYLSESVACFKVSLAILNWESLHAYVRHQAKETHMLHACHT